MLVRVRSVNYSIELALDIFFPLKHLPSRGCNKIITSICLKKGGGGAVEIESIWDVPGGNEIGLQFCKVLRGTYKQLGKNVLSALYRTTLIKV